jgi:hypothetical protein
MTAAITAPAEPAAGNCADGDHGPGPYPPRLTPETWPETAQPREALAERLSAPPFLPGSADVRRSMRRGLTALLDWLEQQPGRTWQDRWLASGAETAGPAWTDLVLCGVPPGPVDKPAPIC